MLTYNSFKAPFGIIFLISEDSFIKKLAINEAELQEYQKKFEIGAYDKSSCSDIILQLEEYFNGKRNKFIFNSSIQGSSFCKKVWQEVMNIPYGETRSYSDLARAVGLSSGPRAVGLANGRNPLPILIPCHRVIGKNGSLKGYLGDNIEIKKFLLDLEGKHAFMHDS